jgi:hypothetical protein
LQWGSLWDNFDPGPSSSAVSPAFFFSSATTELRLVAARDTVSHSPGLQKSRMFLAAANGATRVGAFQVCEHSMGIPTIQ